MSTIIVLKENNQLILATDSRFMNHDFCGIATDAAQKIFEISPETFIAPSGWKMACDFQLTRARELAGELGTTDIQAIGAALALESIPHLEALVEILRSIQHLHEKIRGALDGKLTMHATVLVGWAHGELGYVTQVYRVKAGKIECETDAYFGRTGKIYTTSGDPATQVVQEDPTILNGAPVEVVRKLLAALKSAWPTIGGEDQIVRLDSTGAHWISQPPVGVAGHGLEIATALFAGDAIFAYQNGGVEGGKVTINSLGLTLAEKITSPTTTLTIAAAGITLAKGANILQITPAALSMYDGTNSITMAPTAGVQISSASGSTLTADATSLRIVNGSHSFTVDGTGVTIVGGKLTSPAITVSGGAFTINLDTTNGLKVATATTTLSLVLASVYITGGGGAATNLQAGSLLVSAASGLYQFGGSVNGFNGTVSATQNSGQSASIRAGDASSSTPPSLAMNGTQVVTTRVATTPATLADVIAVLQHHGLSN